MRTFTILSLSTFLLFCGCGTQVPDELRNLVPTTVTVMNGEQPMANIRVTLLAKSSQGAYACNGITGNDGAAQIQSSRAAYVGNGVPAGTYSIVLSEPIEVPADLEPQEEDQNLSPAAQAEKTRKLNEFLNKNRVVPSALTVAGTSPIELIVEKSEATLNIDVSKHR